MSLLRARSNSSSKLQQKAANGNNTEPAKANTNPKPRKSRLAALNTLVKTLPQGTKRGLSAAKSTVYSTINAVNERRVVLVADLEQTLRHLPIRPVRLVVPLTLFALHWFVLIPWAKNAPTSSNGGILLWWPTFLSVLGMYACLTSLGRHYMESNPPPAWVMEWLFAHNLHQVVIHAFLSYAFISTCLHPKTSSYPLWCIVWLNYYNNLWRFLDAIVVISLRRTMQLTFVHVYQRVLLSLHLFLSLRQFPPSTNPPPYLWPLLNSFVDLFTYCHYLLSLLGISWFVVSADTRKAVITQLQMGSYTLGLLHALYSVLVLVFPTTRLSFLPAPNVDVPFSLLMFEIVVMSNMLALLTNFHFVSKKKRSRSESRLAAASQDTSGTTTAVPSTLGAEAAAGSQAASADQPRLVFSFDSSGWLYLYHFGAARYICEHVLPLLPPGSVAFSGSSGGSLAAATLCLGVDIPSLVKYVVSCAVECRSNPWRMLPCAERALDKFLPQNAHVGATHRLRVLLTRITLPYPPFFMGEVKTEFGSRADVLHALRASCHVPFVGGVLPYLGRYYDGFFWGSVFVPWRHISPDDCVVKCSAVSSPTAQITPSVPIPPWWMLVPPSDEVLMGMYEQGYADASKFFSSWEGTKQFTFSKGFPGVRVERNQLHAFRRAVALSWTKLGVIVAALVFLTMVIYSYVCGVGDVVVRAMEEVMHHQHVLV